MPKYQVERSVVIDVPKEKVLKSLQNYKEWKAWSPWLIMDENVEVTYSENQGKVGSSYAWNGEFVGVGNMELLSANETELVMKLEFLKPFKSKADVFFLLEEEGESTKVTWKMKSALPFFLFFMVKQMKTFIGMDYERGLRMLKEYLETDEVSSSVKVEGIVSLEGTRYVGIRKTASFDDLGEVMKKDFETLLNFSKEHNIELKSSPFSIYMSFDMFQRESEFISCIPYHGDVTLPEAFEKGLFETREAFKVVHTGSYEHVGNAWSTAFTHTRVNKVKTNKSPMGMEFYLNSPEEVESKVLLTEVYLPLK